MSGGTKKAIPSRNPMTLLVSSKTGFTGGSSSFAEGTASAHFPPAGFFPPGATAYVMTPSARRSGATPKQSTSPTKKGKLSERFITVFIRKSPLSMKRTGDDAIRSKPLRLVSTLPFPSSSGDLVNGDTVNRLYVNVTEKR